MKWVQQHSPVPTAEAWYNKLNHTVVLVGKEPVGVAGELRWHMSISHRQRYPTWNEIAEARYHFIPDEVTMAMMLPPKEEYINLHHNCFHLFEFIGNEVIADDIAERMLRKFLDTPIKPTTTT